MNSTSLPQYKKLERLLKSQIVKGIYKDGDLLPSENELCTLYGITRPTVRLALTELVNEGYIYKHRGKGSIVKEKKKGLRILSIQGLSSLMNKDALETRVLKKPQIIDWPEEFIFPLSDKEKGAGCIAFERLRLVHGVPTMFEITYIPNSNLPRFTSRSMENKSLFDLMRSAYNIEVKGGEQNMWAIPADKKISKYLSAKPAQPILRLNRKLLTTRNDISIYSIIYCNTNEYHLHDSF